MTASTRRPCSWREEEKLPSAQSAASHSAICIGVAQHVLGLMFQKSEPHLLAAATRGTCRASGHHIVPCAHPGACRLAQPLLQVIAFL